MRFELFGLVIMSRKSWVSAIERNFYGGQGSGVEKTLKALGWRHCAAVRPQEGRYIQVMRSKWDSPRFLKSNEINPVMNVEGLYWKYQDIPPSSGRTAKGIEQMAATADSKNNSLGQTVRVDKPKKYVPGTMIEVSGGLEDLKGVL